MLTIGSEFTEVIKNIVFQVENISDKDANDLIGRLIIGYGNNVINRPPTGNGFFINLPHPTVPDSYNKQFWFNRTSNQWFMRTHENGVFGGWEQK